MSLDESTKRRIAKICDATGWSEQEAAEKMQHAKTVWGIKNSQYVGNRAWEFTEDEMPLFKEVLEIKLEKLRESLDWHAKVICEKTRGGATGLMMRR